MTDTLTPHQRDAIRAIYPGVFFADKRIARQIRKIVREIIFTP
jgi:hypothetical protein